MGYQSLVYSASIANTAGDGPWIDVGGARASQWTIHIKNWISTVSVEVSNEIPVPTTANPNNPSQQRAAYPPYSAPQTITPYTGESHAIAATVTVTNPPAAGSSFADNGVTFGAGPRAGANLIFSPGGPALPGTYNVNASTGVYSFNATDVTKGYAVLLNYTITTPNAGVVLSTTSGYYLPNPPSGSQVLVVAKSDLNVKWVRVRDSAGAGSPPQSAVLAYLHIDK
jgi:hypothetical protein